MKDHLLTCGARIEPEKKVLDEYREGKLVTTFFMLQIYFLCVKLLQPQTEEEVTFTVSGGSHQTHKRSRLICAVKERHTFLLCIMSSLCFAVLRRLSVNDPLL